MIIIRKVRNEERYCVKDKLNSYIFVYVSSREQAEHLKKHWEMETQNADDILCEISYDTFNDFEKRL